MLLKDHISLYVTLVRDETSSFIYVIIFVYLYS